VSGTPRASYCLRVESWHLWPFLTLTPLLLMVLVLFVTRRRVGWTIVAAVAIVLLIFLNVATANSLEFSDTI
jgi:hypothetical protein